MTKACVYLFPTRWPPRVTRRGATIARPLDKVPDRSTNAPPSAPRSGQVGEVSGMRVGQADACTFCDRLPRCTQGDSGARTCLRSGGSTTLHGDLGRERLKAELAERVEPMEVRPSPRGAAPGQVLTRIGRAMNGIRVDAIEASRKPVERN